MFVSYTQKAKQNFNSYFEPSLNGWKGVCSTKEIVGEWVMAFSGTQYEPIHFTIIDQAMPGDPRTFEPLVDIGNC